MEFEGMGITFSELMLLIVNYVKSSLSKIECGVPQGSVLAPLFFTIYINVIQKHLVLKISDYFQTTQRYSCHAQITHI